MKYDKTKSINGLDGKQITEQPGNVAITFGLLVTTCLLAEAQPTPGSSQLSSAQKVQQFQLALRVQNAEQFFEISIEEAAQIRKSLSVLPIIYVGRCFEIMDKPEVDPPAATPA